MVQRQNTGLAVSNAKRLNDCFNELSEAIAARPAMNGDRDLWAHDYAALPGGPAGGERADWNHRCGSRDVALVALRGAVTSGLLPLWIHCTQGESKADRYALRELTFHTFASGTYQPVNRTPECEGLVDRALWIKERDWRQYLADLWAMRYGIDLAHPAPPADKQLLPPDSQFVTLSHALTWIAFGISMDCNQLHEVLTLDRYSRCDPQEAIKAAVAELVEIGRDARISMQGKFRLNHREEVRTLLTTPIEPIKFADYRQFNYLCDELRHGEGLTWWRTMHGVVDRLAGGGRAESYIEIGVNRADLLRQYRPNGPIELNSDAILWSDLEPDVLERAKGLAREAESDEWWNWPQAVAWAGCRNIEHIATMRLCAEPWTRDRNDHSIALGAEQFLGTAYCSNPERAERDLHRAIERGAVKTQGRYTSDGISEGLKPTDWRGGKVVFNRTATLVSAADTLSEWACDVAVSRADLMIEFPSIESALAASNQTPAGPKGEVECATPKARGRTKGTGYQRADAPILREMATAIASNSALNATSAARLFAPEAEGASIEAKVDRLARAYRAGRNRG